MNRLRLLRILSLVTAGLLAVQFEFGIAVNLSPNLQEVSPPPETSAAAWNALAKVGGDATTHAILGTLLALVALVVLVVAIESADAAVVVTAIVGFLAMAGAVLNGVLFTMSGFKTDGYSHGMATTFIVSFAAQFVLAILLTARLNRRAAAK